MGKTNTIWLNDSTKYTRTEVIPSQVRIDKLVDSIEQVVLNHSGTQANTIVRVKETINYDSLYTAFNSSLRDSVDKYKNMSRDSFGRQTLATYKYESKWLKQKGRILGAGIAIDSLQVITNQHLIITESKSKLLKPSTWFQSKKIYAEMINENPAVTYSEHQIYTYSPKKSRLGLVIGPTVTYDGSKLRPGFGLTAGFRIL